MSKIYSLILKIKASVSETMVGKPIELPHRRNRN
jgi:hypothetical protein